MLIALVCRGIEGLSVCRRSIPISVSRMARRTRGFSVFVLDVSCVTRLLPILGFGMHMEFDCIVGVAFTRLRR
jgi:hypothetical protein